MIDTGPRPQVHKGLIFYLSLFETFSNGDNSTKKSKTTKYIQEHVLTEITNMAQLSSPGISVTVVDESFYTPAAPGTVPLIIVASQENKQNSAGTGIAPGTLKANAGKVYLLTSQSDLGATFGVPFFQTDANNNPVNAGELNEYGLQAAYSFLGISNRAYVVRADVDTTQLEAATSEPTSPPADGTFWFDTADTHYGVFEWNSNPATISGGQLFTNKTVSVITDDNLVSAGAPISSFGALGSYAIVATTTLNKLFLKKYKTSTAAGTWVEVGTSAWKASWPTLTTAVPGAFSGSDVLKINGYSVTGATTVDGLVSAVGSHITGVTAANINGSLQLYSTGVDIVIGGDSTAGLLTELGIEAGSYLAPMLQLSPHYTVPEFGLYDQAGYVSGFPTGSMWIKTTGVNLGADWIIKKYNESAATWIEQSTKLFATPEEALATLDPTGGGFNLPVGAVYVKYNDDEDMEMPRANFKIYGRSGTGAMNITTSVIGSTFSTSSAGLNTFTISESQIGDNTLTAPVTVSFTAQGTSGDANRLLSALQAALADTLISATLNANNSITITHTAGGDIRFVDGTNSPLGEMFSLSTTANWFVDPTGNADMYIATLWTATVGDVSFTTASETPLTTTANDGTLWYNSTLEDVDIMVHNGTTWVGYRNYTQNGVGGDATDPNGPIISATKPTKQSDGTALANGDLWIETSNLEEYPLIHKFNFLTKKWVLLDNTDQTTGNGVVFHDARAGLNGGSWDETTQTGVAPAGSIQQLLTSNFLDFDAPDPAMYPRGILLWNLRRSGFNVKKYSKNYVDHTERNLRNNDELMNMYYPDRWTSEAPNDTMGVGQFGRKAQRAVVLKALNETIQSNQGIRQPDSVIFNLLSCPGYLETLSPLVGLNTDNGETAFIISDAPARLTPDATSLSNWGNNSNGAAVDGEDGLIATSSLAAVYYPWGYTTDLTGNNIVVPPSHIMLRTIALSDNVSYPWFAPAGVRRGGVTNASSVGYVDGQSGEFITVALNVGQRDTLAAIHVNPITYIAGTGLVVYGQKTRQLIASSLDRINVARLVIYLRYQLNQLAKPFVFEPNDTITRNEIKQQVEKLLLELTAERALYDYLVVCDTSNNTPSRIDRNELYVDIAIEPVKAVEFIYIPLRLENTGAIKGLGK